MKIYIDKDCRCYTEPAEGRREQESSFFDGRGKRFIEGYRFVPDGETWTRSDGTVFSGEMISPIENPIILGVYDNLDKTSECLKATSDYIVQAEIDKAMAELESK